MNFLQSPWEKHVQNQLANHVDMNQLSYNMAAAKRNDEDTADEDRQELLLAR
jgi:hypothetical protein